MLAWNSWIAWSRSVGRCRLEQHGGGPEAHREGDHPAEAEGEADRRAADEHVVRAGPERRAREAVADRHDVAMEVHRALRPAGGARGEGDQRDVVARGVEVGELGRFAPHALLELGAGPGQARAVEAADALAHRRAGARLLELQGQALVAQREPDLGLIEDHRELARAQKWHRGDRDAAGLEHAEPAGDQHRVVGRAQQHPVARHEAEVVAQHPRDPVRPLEELAVGPALVRRAEDGLVGAARARPCGRAAPWRSSGVPDTAAPAGRS